MYYIAFISNESPFFFFFLDLFLSFITIGQFWADRKRIGREVVVGGVGGQERSSSRDTRSATLPTWLLAPTWIPFLTFLFCLLNSTSSKQRKNVISCVTVHDSPNSDSSNTSPYAVESRANGPNANGYDSKGALLDNYSNRNSRTIIIPPLKCQPSENLGDCDRLLHGETGEGQISWQRKTITWHCLNQASI